MSRNGCSKRSIYPLRMWLNYRCCYSYYRYVWMRCQRDIAKPSNLRRNLYSRSRKRSPVSDSFSGLGQRLSFSFFIDGSSSPRVFAQRHALWPERRITEGPSIAVLTWLIRLRLIRLVIVESCVERQSIRRCFSLKRQWNI